MDDCGYRAHGTGALDPEWEHPAYYADCCLEVCARCDEPLDWRARVKDSEICTGCEWELEDGA